MIPASNTTLMKSYDLFYRPYDITWKDVFCLALHFKRKYFVLNDHIFMQNHLFFVFVLRFYDPVNPRGYVERG